MPNLPDHLVPEEFAGNEWFVEEQYERYQQDKNLVDPSWWPIFQSIDKALQGTPTASAPATTVTTETVTTTGTPAKPSATPAVAAPRTTPTKPALATTGPSIAVAVVAAGLLGAGAVLVMRRRQAS